MTDNPLDAASAGSKFDRDLLARQLATWGAMAEPDIIDFTPPKHSLKNLAYSEILMAQDRLDNTYESMIRATRDAANEVQEKLIASIKARVDNDLTDLDNWVLQITPLTSYSDYQISDNEYTFFLEQNYTLRPKTDKEKKLKARSIDRCGFCFMTYADHEAMDLDHGFLFVEEWKE